MKEKYWKWTNSSLLILGQLLNLIFNVAVMLSYAGFVLVFVNSQMGYFKELPDLIKMALPIGFIAIGYRIFKINWGLFPYQTKREQGR